MKTNTILSKDRTNLSLLPAPVRRALAIVIGLLALGGSALAQSGGTVLLQQLNMSGAYHSSQYFDVTVPAGINFARFQFTAGSGASGSVEGVFRDDRIPTIADLKGDGVTPSTVYAKVHSGTYHVLIYGWKAFKGINFTVTGFAVAPPRDFNGDTKPDLIFQYNPGSGGQLVGWYLDGTGNAIDFSTGSGVKGSGYVFNGGLGDWVLVGYADLDGDGVYDLLFQNSAGQLYAWFLDGSGQAVNATTGAGRASARYLYSGGLGDWRVVACADVNGDGKVDLVFQNTAGQLYAWFLDGTGGTIDPVVGTGRIGVGYLSSAALGDWRVVACADINNDGKADLIFQNTAGQVYAWFLDGTGQTVNTTTGAGRLGTKFLTSGGLGDWRIVATADVNSDGFPDLVFQNNAGQVVVWTMDGSGNTLSRAFLYSSALGPWRAH